MKLLQPTLKAVAAKRPKGETAPKENLCADKAYAGEKAARAMRRRGYTPHVRQRGEEAAAKKRNPHYRPRRWVVERAHSWLNRFRKLLVRFEKKAASHEALLELACSLIVYRQVIVIYG